MKYIALPSGIIINLNQVAYVVAPGIFGDQDAKNATLQVHFSALAIGQRGGGSLHLSLVGEDITAFLTEMTTLCLKTDATLTSVTKKQN